MPELRIGRWVLVLTIAMAMVAALPGPVAAADGSWRDAAVPLGETVEFGPYEISVLEVTPDATDTILDARSFGQEPEPGEQYFMIRVETVYLGDETGKLSLDLAFRAVGLGNVGYTVHRDHCGVIPDQVFDIPDLEPGDSAEFNICWLIASSDAGSLAMYVYEYVDFTDDPMWFSLGFDDEQPAASPSKLRAGASIAIDESSERNPVSPGEVAVVGDYLVTVIEVVAEADDLIVEAFSFNDPPARGNQFFMVTISVTYTGPEIGVPWIDLDFYGVGDGNPQYNDFDDTCGVVPESSITTGDVFQNGTVEFNVCWQIDSDDADDLLMMVESFWTSSTSDPMWFSLAD